MQSLLGIKKDWLRLISQTACWGLASVETDELFLLLILGQPAAQTDMHHNHSTLTHAAGTSLHYHPAQQCTHSMQAKLLAIPDPFLLRFNALHNAVVIDIISLELLHS